MRAVGAPPGLGSYATALLARYVRDTTLTGWPEYQAPLSEIIALYAPTDPA